MPMPIPMRSLLVATCLAAGILAPCAPAAAEPPGAETPAETPAAVAEAVERYLAHLVAGGVPGVSVALTRGREVVLTTGAGTTSAGTPVDQATRMRIESLSKSFTATAVMQLVDRGEVILDEPVARYLTKLVIDDPRAATITVRQLLNHSSGLSDRTGIDEYEPGPRTLSEAVARLRSASLTTNPGTRFNYHNANYHLAARLVEVVSGEPFDSYLRQHVFAPLGMTATTNTATAAAQVPGLARGHTFAYGRPVAATGPDYFVSGAGGIVSTAADMARWLVLQHGDGRAPDSSQIVSTTSLTEMHRRQAPDDYLYALGWYHGPSAAGGPVRTSHSGAGASYGAYQGLFPNGVGIAVLVNHGSALGAPDPYAIAEALHTIMDGGSPPAAPAVAGSARDLLLTLLATALLALAVRGVLRSRTWARRHRPRRAVLRILPQALLVGVVSAAPDLQLLATGRTASWTLVFFVAPVPTAALLTVTAITAVVSTLRLAWLIRTWRGATSARSRPARVTTGAAPPRQTA